VKAAGVGAVLGLVCLVGNARADVIVPAAGITRALAFGDGGGWGLEATLDYLRTDCGAGPGLGLIYQWEAGGARQLGGVQVFAPGFGVEAGLAVRSEAGRSFTLHLAPFIASGVLSGALRFGVPLHSGAAFEFGLVLALKVPWVLEI
jgi:hypothetical protein